MGGGTAKRSAALWEKFKGAEELRHEAETAKICNFWTFWPVVQLINDLFKNSDQAY